jgi:hypothetical protein
VDKPGQDLALQKLPDNHRKGGHVDLVPLSGGGSEQLGKWKHFLGEIQSGKVKRRDMKNNQSIDTRAAA